MIKLVRDPEQGPYFEGDILIEDTDGGRAGLNPEENKQWPEGVVPFKISEDFSKSNFS